MNNIKVTILIPMLNSITFLGECLDSIQNQELQEIEIICVDAGSTDGTVEMIQSYVTEDQRIRLIQTPEKSYGIQLNLGIAAAEGDYIGIVESDDYISSDHYRILYEKAETARPDYVKGGFLQFGTLGTRNVFETIARSHECIEQLTDLNEHSNLRLFDPVHIWSGIYRTEFLRERQIQFNPTSGASYQDTSFSLLVGMLADTCIYTEKCSYYYRIDNENSSVKSDSKIHCIIDEYQYLLSELDKRHLYQGAWKQAIDSYRLISYFWNFRRMSKEGRLLFVDAIQEELQVYKDHYDQLAKAEQKVLDYLGDRQGAACYEETDRALEAEYKEFLQLVCTKQKFIFVSMGKNAKRLLHLIQTLELDLIEDICDHNKSMHGRQFGHFTIRPLRETVTDNKKQTYLILHPKNPQEIQKQLLGLGVPAEQIHSLTHLPSFSWMVLHLKEYL